MTVGCAHRQGSPGSAEAQSCRLPQVKHASSKCAEHRRFTHRVDQLGIPSDRWWGGLQQAASRLGLHMQEWKYRWPSISNYASDGPLPQNTVDTCGHISCSVYLCSR